MRYPLAFAFIGAITACGDRAAVATLAVDGRTNDNVTLSASGNFVAAAWAASEQSSTDIFAAVSIDGGTTFSAPVRVNATAGDARAGGELPPQIVVVPRAGAIPDLAVVWTAKRAEGTRLLVARSTDGGHSFGATEVVRASEATGNRGWQSVAVDSSGRVLTAWLDHRNTAPMSGTMHHHGDATPAPSTATKQDPVEKAELSQIYFADVGDSVGRSMAKGVCYCCKTALAASHGRLYAAWRNVFAGNQRDIAFTTSVDGGATFAEPSRVSDDKWEFDGCPENGPSIAIDSTHRVHVVWPTPVDGKAESPLALFHAMSSDGASFSPRQQVITKGPALHVRAIALRDSTVLLAWEEVAGQSREVRLARGMPGAMTMSFSDQPLGTDPVGTYPAAAATADGAVVAWTAREPVAGQTDGKMRGVIRVTRVGLK